ncbi:I78 family peptidase inhibitor [Sphingomonas sp.]|uniref:I78 family peptidase inhibitor n=1 Tax=Sphingomonas sp. TaxID=28214 RepID=UPI0031D72B8B
MAALAACTQTKAPPSRAEQMAELPAEACGDGRVADLMGKRWNESMRAATLARAGAKTLRVIAPGMAVTMDYRVDRLNIETDAAGTITRIRCG